MNWYFLVLKLYIIVLYETSLLSCHTLTVDFRDYKSQTVDFSFYQSRGKKVKWEVNFELKLGLLSPLHRLNLTAVAIQQSGIRVVAVNITSSKSASENGKLNTKYYTN